MATRNIVPRANGEGSVGTTEKHWGSGWMDETNTDAVMPVGNDNQIGASNKKWKEGHFEKLPNWQEYLAESTGYGIVSGLQVKAQDMPNMTVSIEGGTVHMKNGTRIVIAAIAALTIAMADVTNPRIDSIYVDGTGNVAYAQGTPAATPVAPTLSTDAIKLADVNVAADQASVTEADIVRDGEVLPRFYNTGIVNVKDFGAKGDGVTDDTAAIQSAIDYAGKKGTVYFPKGIYTVSRSIESKGRNIIINKATIRASNNFTGEYVLYFRAEEGAALNTTWQLSLIGIGKGTISCNGNVSGGVYVGGIQDPVVRDIEVSKAVDVGFFIDEKDESQVSSVGVFENLQVMGHQNVVTRIGYKIDGFDNTFKSLRTYGCLIGVQVNGGGNYFIDCHPCGEDGNYENWDSRIAFDINAYDTFMSHSYSDNYKTGWSINGDYRLYATNSFYLTITQGNVERQFVKCTGNKFLAYFVNSIVSFPSAGNNIGYTGPEIGGGNFINTTAYNLSSLYDPLLYSSGLTAAGSNPNFLVNWDFTNPVNTNGQTTYTTGDRCIDRWYKWGDTNTVTLTSDGLIWENTGNNLTFAQYRKRKKISMLIGQVVTLTVEVADIFGNIEIWVGESDVKETRLELKNKIGFQVFTFKMPAWVNDDSMGVKFGAVNSQPCRIKIKRVKLELGNQSTLAKDGNSNVAIEKIKTDNETN